MSHTPKTPTPFVVPTKSLKTPLSHSTHKNKASPSVFRTSPLINNTGTPTFVRGDRSPDVLSGLSQEQRQLEVNILGEVRRYNPGPSPDLRLTASQGENLKLTIENNIKKAKKRRAIVRQNGNDSHPEGTAKKITQNKKFIDINNTNVEAPPKSQICGKEMPLARPQLLPQDNDVMEVLPNGQAIAENDGSMHDNQKSPGQLIHKRKTSKSPCYTPKKRNYKFKKFPYHGGNSNRQQSTSDDTPMVQLHKSPRRPARDSVHTAKSPCYTPNNNKAKPYRSPYRGENVQKHQSTLVNEPVEQPLKSPHRREMNSIVTAKSPCYTPKKKQQQLFPRSPAQAMCSSQYQPKSPRLGDTASSFRGSQFYDPSPWQKTPPRPTYKVQCLSPESQYDFPTSPGTLRKLIQKKKKASVKRQVIQQVLNVINKCRREMDIIQEKRRKLHQSAQFTGKGKEPLHKSRGLGRRTIQVVATCASGGITNDKYEVSQGGSILEEQVGFTETYRRGGYGRPMTY